MAKSLLDSILLLFFKDISSEIEKNLFAHLHFRHLKLRNQITSANNMNLK